MRRLHATVGAGVMLLAMTACAGQQEDVGFGGQPPKPPPGPVKPKPENQRTPVPAEQLPPNKAGDVWTQEDGKVVVATGREGGCSKVHAEAPQQDENQVKIVLVNETPDPPGACTMDIRYPDVAVRLDKPLDQRTIVIEKQETKVPR